MIIFHPFIPFFFTAKSNPECRSCEFAQFRINVRSHKSRIRTADICSLDLHTLVFFALSTFALLTFALLASRWCPSHFCLSHFCRDTQFSDLIWTFSTHYIFVRKLTCMKNIKINCIWNLLDLLSEPLLYNESWSQENQFFFTIWVLSDRSCWELIITTTSHGTSRFVSERRFGMGCPSHLQVCYRFKKPTVFIV